MKDVTRKKEINELIKEFYNLSELSTIIGKIEFLQIYKHDNVIDMNNLPKQS